jgi:hypothetical protein
MLTGADAQWPSYRLAAFPLSTRWRKSASPLRVFSHDSTRTPAPLPRVLLASSTARQAGFPERFVEVMSACWDSGSSRLKKAATLRLYARPPRPLLSTQSGQPRPHHTRARDVGAGDRIECAGMRRTVTDKYAYRAQHAAVMSHVHLSLVESALPSLQIRRSALRWRKCATLCTRCTAPRCAGCVRAVLCGLAIGESIAQVQREHFGA